MTTSSSYLFAALLTFPTLAHAETKAFGEKISLTAATPLKSALTQPSAFQDKDILTAGVVEKVCEKKGCWMTIKTDAEDVRVTFKDYAFFVPLGSGGKAVRMQGRLAVKELSVAEQKHLLEDGGAPKTVIDAVKAPKKEFSFVASGVEIGG